MLDVGILVLFSIILFSIIFKLQCSILFNFISVNCEALHCSHLTKLHFFLPSIAKHLQNYTGDRLNFGLAAEQAKSEGYKMEVDKHTHYYVVWQIILILMTMYHLSSNCRWSLLEMIVPFPHLEG